MQLLDKFATCPCCGSGMDVYLDHALVCSCGGDRTLRHNAVRDQVFSEANEAGLRVEREKAGLLPPRPGDEALRGERGNQANRRPADIWLASWQDNRAAAVDFAVTSGLKADSVGTAASNTTVIWSNYEHFKR